jgi:hypothetical protein
MLEARTAPHVALLRARLALKVEAPLPPSPGGDSLVVVPFDFTTPSQVFLTYPSGTIFSLAGVIVETPFNAPATMRLGSSADLSMLLGAIDSRLTIADQYQSDAVIVTTAADVLMLTMNAAGASVGSGYIFYRV